MFLCSYSAPGIFQRAMERLLVGIPNALCYLDDILVFGENQLEHDTTLRQVFKVLQDAGLRLSKGKCSISLDEVTYLGFKINGEGLNPTEDKITAIKLAPQPQDVKQLKSYLGLLNFYRRFIPNASTLLEPLNRLLKANTRWSWSTDQERAFQASKEALIKSEALVHFDPAKPIVVSADSSDYGIGAVLCHKLDGAERPVCFVSRTLNDTERRYSPVRMFPI